MSESYKLVEDVRAFADMGKDNLLEAESKSLADKQLTLLLVQNALMAELIHKTQGPDYMKYMEKMVEELDDQAGKLHSISRRLSEILLLILLSMVAAIILGVLWAFISTSTAMSGF